MKEGIYTKSTFVYAKANLNEMSQAKTVQQNPKGKQNIESLTKQLSQYHLHGHNKGSEISLAAPVPHILCFLMVIPKDVAANK